MAEITAGSGDAAARTKHFSNLSGAPTALWKGFRRVDAA